MASYTFPPPPLRDGIAENPIRGRDGLALTEPWAKWFAELSRSFLYGWDDLRFPVSAINPLGAASDPTRDSNTGLLSFAGNADNVIAGVAQMPHSWAAGGIVRPHIHLVFPTSASANTRWKFEYDVASVGDDFTNALGTYTTLDTITVANPQNVKEHVIAGFGDLDLAGYRESTCILWRVSRLASSDAADDDANACTLLEFDIHYQRGKDGTVSEYPGA